MQLQQHRDLQLLVILILSLVLTPNIVSGQPLQFGAHNGALGNATTGYPLANWSVMNPANAGYLDSGSISFHAVQAYGLKELLIGSTQMTLPFSKGAFLLNAQSLGFDSFRETQVSAGLARSFKFGSTRNIMIASVATMKRTGIQNYGSVNTWSITLGLSLALSPQVFLGSTAVNYIQQQSIVPLRKLLLIGLSFQPAKNTWLMATIAQHQFFRPSFRMGLDLQIMPFLALRSGFSSSPANYAMGAGLFLYPLRVELAAEHHNALGWTPGFSIDVAFMRRKDASKGVN